MGRGRLRYPRPHPPSDVAVRLRRIPIRDRERADRRPCGRRYAEPASLRKSESAGVRAFLVRRDLGQRLAWVALVLACAAVAAEPETPSGAVGAVVALPSDAGPVRILNEGDGAFRDTGPPLVYSDDPETVNEHGILYADTLPAGRARVYVYHVNGTEEPARCDVLVAAAETPCRVAVRRAVGAIGPKDAAIGLCRRAAAAWLDPARSASGPTTAISVDSTPVPIAAEALGRELAPDDLCHAFLELESSGPVRIIVTFAPAGEGGWRSALDRGILPGDGYRRQGTFPHADRRAPGPLVWRATGESAAIVIGKGPADPPPEGRDAESGGSALLKGSYGVEYEIPLLAQIPDERVLDVLVLPRGGAYGGAFAVETPGACTVVTLPADRHAHPAGAGALRLARIPAKVARAGFTIRTTPNGGCSLPIEILLRSVPAD